MRVEEGYEEDGERFLPRSALLPAQGRLGREGFSQIHRSAGMEAGSGGGYVQSHLCLIFSCIEMVQ